MFLFFLMLYLKNVFSIFLQPLYDFWNHESTSSYRDLTTVNSQNVIFLSEFPYLIFVLLYACYWSNLFIGAKQEVSGDFQLHSCAAIWYTFTGERSKIKTCLKESCVARHKKGYDRHEKKISRPQFLSYDNQNFFGVTLNNLEGRHVFFSYCAVFCARESRNFLYLRADCVREQLLRKSYASRTRSPENLTRSPLCWTMILGVISH